MAIELAIDGASECHWNNSATFFRLPHVSCKDIIASSRRLVVVAPHPDDEVLGCGGLIAEAANTGIPLVIISVTDGEHCYPANTYWTPERLRYTRRQELRTALDALRISDPEVLHLAITDGRVRESADSVVRILVDCLYPSDLLLATWEQDGHPDHNGVGRAARIASQQTGCRLLQYPIWGRRVSKPGIDPFGNVKAMRLELEPAGQALKAKALDAFKTQSGHSLPSIDEPVLSSTMLMHFTGSFEIFIR